MCKRHIGQLQQAVPRPQEIRRHRACNAVIYAKHFSAWLAVVLEYVFTAEWVCDLDESSCTRGKDLKAVKCQKRFMRPCATKDAQDAEFINTHRMKMMHATSASGEVGYVLYVFKGAVMPYRTMFQNGNAQVETLASHLPGNILMSMRKEGGGVEDDNFFEWGKASGDHVKLFTAGRRRVLVTYDGYRSHLALRVLTLFRDNGTWCTHFPGTHRERRNLWTHHCFVPSR